VELGVTVTLSLVGVVAAADVLALGPVVVVVPGVLSFGFGIALSAGPVPTLLVAPAPVVATVVVAGVTDSSFASPASHALSVVPATSNAFAKTTPREDTPREHTPRRHLPNIRIIGACTGV
jgi:hypothetical protein